MFAYFIVQMKKNGKKMEILLWKFKIAMKNNDMYD